MSEHVNNGNVALDRSPLKQHGQVQLATPRLPPPSPPLEPTKSSPLQASRSHRSIRRSLGDHKHSTAIKLRKALHISEPSDEQSISTHSILANDTTKPSESRIDHDLPVPDKSTIKDLFHSPIDTIKDKIIAQSGHQTATSLAAREIPHAQEVDLIKAYDHVERAKTDAERIDAVGDLDRLIRERQVMYVRWTVDRHVTKCRVLPRETFVRRSLSSFKSRTDQGDDLIDWKAYGIHQLQYYAQIYGGQYIGFGSSPPPPTKESIMPNVERVIIASAPFQEFIMTTRKVYRWEDPTETSKYLAIFLILWYFDLLLPGTLSAIVYLVVHRRLRGNTLETIRKDLKRTEDLHETALTITEFIEKEGDELWVEKLLQDFGPWLMTQLCDTANMFEVMRNFYEWRVPSQTLTTLSVLLFSIILTTFAPLWLIVKSITLGSGITFFGLFPLATNFTDYRLLASIPRRVFWNIPTHAEWAFASLQAEGTGYQHRTHDHGPERLATEHGGEVDYGFYTGHYNGDRGRLIISAFSIRFETNIGHRVTWTLNYDEIKELEKINRIKSKTISIGGSGMDLRIAAKRTEQRELMLVDMVDRDQAFSQIVGFSKTRWQIVW